MVRTLISSKANGGPILTINSTRSRADHLIGLNNKGLDYIREPQKLEESLARFMQVSMSNHKSTESAIKNLEIQVGQLAKQIADSSSSKFGANTENNPKEECKVVMTHGRMATMAEEEKDEKIYLLS